MSSKNERKKGLGRGLSSFLDVDSFEEIVERSNDENNVDILTNSSNFLPIERLFPNQNQPRKTFSSDELKLSLLNKRNGNNTTDSCKKD